MKQNITILIILISLNVFGQTNWYVDYQNGNNSNNGTSHTIAVQTVEYLTSNDLLQPGDTVFIMGEYHNPDYDPNFSYRGNNDRNNPHIWLRENTIRLQNLYGAENQYITFKPFDNNTVIKGDGANIFRIRNSSYIRIEGFEIYGEVEHIPLSTAEGLLTDGLQFLYLDSNTIDEEHPTLSEVLYRVNVGTTTTEIENANYPIIGNITRPSYTNTRGIYMSGSNHIDIANNHIHHMPGVGLLASQCAYVNIESNEIDNCSRRSYAGTHALVVTKAMEGMANATDDPVYSIRILRNLVRNNYNEIFSWVGTKDFITPRIDEGKGISLQRNNLSSWQNGNKRILIENNLCYWNGFSGVHSNDGYHIDMINNTCYMNSYTNTVTYANDQRGNNIGISTSDGGDIKIINNISVIDVDWGAFPISSNGNTLNLEVDHNIVWGANGTVTQDADVTAIQTNTTVSDPMFADTNTNDFHLSQNAPAIDSANPIYAPANDFYNNLRDSNPDIGAIEYIAPQNVSEYNANIVSVYPNPFTDKIAIDQNINKGEISIFNVLGQDVSNNVSIINNGQKTEIITKDLPSGMYIIKTNTSVYKVYKSLYNR